MALATKEQILAAVDRLMAGTAPSPDIRNLLHPLIGEANRFADELRLAANVGDIKALPVLSFDIRNLLQPSIDEANRFADELRRLAANVSDINPGRS